LEKAQGSRPSVPPRRSAHRLESILSIPKSFQSTKAMGEPHGFFYFLLM
jgi:hypothetical protein